ncbi:DUF2621 domain-containing protein [Oceanobacillus iheyensis]|uniref:Hypothetical conserved protein n=1 Tax=Oceanobacillus iheyensis (strain DSM 14371 / CIP 107618 / JCM 11309 / KCTC 3954 / HTE831) TaxID=221109 RepID=Q8EQL6_OCEIH|nr:DUF2621 domain-containing protein [Oceanobacillus iheyensis]BAC13635.1 hypothetical conserved protein [Oceanobacillus iheyensis HTE831]
MSIILVLWGFLLISLMAIGGYFMFRKFLKRLPKEDGRSIMDWEEHYLEETRHKWNDEEKSFLEELVSPVPELFRDVARQRIASKIGELSINKQENIIQRSTVIEGYIIATPKRDHKFLRKKLKQKNIDTTPYEPLFQQSKDNYEVDWEQKYQK